MTSIPVQPHELLDDGFAPPACDVLVIGCGNILRGDDAFGPRLIRELWTRGLPERVRCADGGTAGMDVAFQMRGAGRVVIVDAASTGSAPGTIYRVPAAEVTAPRQIDGLHTHSFRWDHALAFAAWLLGPECPTDITVFLAEVDSVDFGADLSESATAALPIVADLIEQEFFTEVRS